MQGRPYLVDRVSAHQKQVPRLAEKWKAQGIDQDRLGEPVVQVPVGCGVRPAAPLELRAVAALDVPREIIDGLLRHPELDVHEDLVVVVRAEGLGRRDDLEAVGLHSPQEVTAVLGVPSEPIELPAEDPLGLTPREALEHCLEDRATGSLRRSGLAENLGDVDAKARGQGFELDALGIDGRNLPVFGRSLSESRA
jgi:hypothetical protein